MRVLHSITCLTVGGAEVMLYRHLRHAGRAAREAVVMSLMEPGPVAPLIRETGAAVETLGLSKGGVDPTRVIRLRRIRRRVAPALIHGWMYHGNLAGALAQAGAGAELPVIWSVHHSLDDIAREPRMTQAVIRACAWLSPRASAIIYCSRASQAQHEALGFDASRSIVIPNGVDHEEFAPRPGAGERLRAMFGIPAGRVVIGHVARAHPMKDARALLQAIAQLAEAGRDVHGLFVGEGHSGPTAQAAAALGLGDRVTIAGARGDVAEIMPGLDVFALSSAWGEAFPLSVSEAMASGVPAVVTDVGDCAWLVGPAGEVAPPQEPEALAAALGRMVDLGPDGRRRLGLAARERVVRNFSMDAYARRHAELYERTMLRAALALPA